MPPTVIVCEAGLIANEKFGTGFTTSVTVAECERLPLVPVMVIVKLPAGVEPLVETLSVEDPEPLTEVGLKLAEAPAGNPLALKETLPLKPLIAPMEAV